MRAGPDENSLYENDNNAFQFRKIENENVLTTEFEPPNELEKVYGIGEFFQRWLEKNLKHQFTNPEERQKYIDDAVWAFREALTNAISYGNLKWQPKPDEYLHTSIKVNGMDISVISTSKRINSVNEWAKKHPEFRKLKSKVTFEMHANCIMVKIFDHDSKFLLARHPEKDPTDENKLFDQTGRGLLLINTFFDKVTMEKSGEGKVLTMKKYFEKPEVKK